MTDTRPSPTPFDAHAFEGDADAPADSECAFCSHPRASILHHPSRIRATLAMARRARVDESQAG